MQGWFPFRTVTVNWLKCRYLGLTTDLRNPNLLEGMWLLIFYLYFQILCASYCMLPQILNKQEKLTLSGSVLLSLQHKERELQSRPAKTELDPFHRQAKGGPKSLKVLSQAGPPKHPFTVHPNGQVD